MLHLTNIKNKFFYNLFEAIQTNGLRKYRFYKILSETQWNKKLTDELALRKINTLLKQIKPINQFYKTHLKDYPVALTNIEQLKSFPVMGKAEIRNFNTELCSSIKEKHAKSKTSGSTGIPITAYINRYALDWRIAGYYRFLSWYNIKPYDKNVLLWAHAKFNTRGFLSKLKHLIYSPQYFINIFELNEKSFPVYYRALLKYKPRLFKSYPSGAFQFSLLAKNLNFDLKALEIQLVVTTGELLTDDNRKFIEESFGCKVANEYGAAEVAQIAFECPYGNMHVPQELVYIWTNDQKEVFITNLDNYYFPFINYRVGDLVEISDETCKCGRCGSVLTSIIGRNSDQIVLPDGKMLSQTRFTYLFKDVGLKYGLHCIEQWRVTQDSLTFSFEIIKGKEFNDKAIDYIKQKCLSDISDKISITFVFPERIEKEASGKLRYFIRKN